MVEESPRTTAHVTDVPVAIDVAELAVAAGNDFAFEADGRGAGLWGVRGWDAVALGVAPDFDDAVW